MTSRPCKQDKKVSLAEDIIAANEKGMLYRRTWRNWFFLASVLVLTTIGLASAIPPLVSERIFRPWPWIKTDLVLVVGLSLMVLAFVGYLTLQQRLVLRMHTKLQQLTEEVEKRMQQHTERLYAIANISHIIGAETNLQSIFQSITNICAESFNCHRTSLMLLDEDGQDLVVRSASGQYDPGILEAHQKIGEGIAGWAAAHREAILLQSPDDCARYPDLKFDNPLLTSTMVVPIYVREEIVGVINVCSKSPDIRYNREDLRALQIFAENVGACIRHAEHVNWMRQMLQQVEVPKQKKQKSYIVRE
jgi:transcriptional regulator with GAF, ATPase, and Fis domain